MLTSDSFPNGVSIVVPVYNEVDNVEALHQEILTACLEIDQPFEIIFVDDGSTDGTAQRLKQLSPVKVIRFRKNFGQTAAMDAGIKAASFSLVVTMDGDGQNDPADIARLIQHLEENDLDIVSGWRKKRKDDFSKRFISRGAKYLRDFLLNDQLQDSGCSLKVYRRECFEGVHLYGEMHRFIPALLRIQGFQVGELEVAHRPRTAGVTKYNWTKRVKAFADSLFFIFWTKFSARAQHLLGAAGLLTLLLGLLMAMFGLAAGLTGATLSTPLLVTTALFVIAGLQLLLAGLAADMKTKIFFHLAGNRTYSIKEIAENTEMPKNFFTEKAERASRLATEMQGLSLDRGHSSSSEDPVDSSSKESQSQRVHTETSTNRSNELPVAETSDDKTPGTQALRGPLSREDLDFAESTGQGAREQRKDSSPGETSSQQQIQDEASPAKEKKDRPRFDFPLKS